MKYALLIYGEESRWESLSPEQIAEEMGAYFAYTNELVASGKMLGGEELHPVATAKTVSLIDGKHSVVDGPFADTKETLGGLYVIEAESHDDALAWAAKCPGARSGRIEVRPVVVR